MANFSFTSFRLAAAAIVLGAAALVQLTPANAAWPQGISNANVVRTITASNGDIFIGGNFVGEAKIGEFTLYSAGLQDVFVARLTPSGNVLWAVSGGGDLTDTLHGMAIDTSGNVFVAGSVFGSANFGGVGLNGSTNNYQDGFVARIDANGIWGWVNRITSNGRDSATDVVVYPGDSMQVPPLPDTLLVTGGYFGTATFSASGTSRQLVNTNGMLQDDFLAKLSVDGKKWHWAVNRPGVGVYEIGKRLLLDDQKRLHMLGEESAKSQWLVFKEEFPRGSNLDAWVVAEDTGFAHFVDDSHYAQLRAVFGPDANPGLALHGGKVSVILKDPIDSSLRKDMSINVKVRRGSTITGSFTYDGELRHGNISEVPDGDQEYLTLDFLRQDGEWEELERFPVNPYNSGSDELFSYQHTYQNPHLFHRNLKFRFRQHGGNGFWYDWWFVEGFEIELPVNKVYLHTVSNLASLAPAPPLRWENRTHFEGSTGLSDATLWKDGNTTRIAIVGHAGAALSQMNECPPVAGPPGRIRNGFLAVVNPQPATYRCTSMEMLDTASPGAVVGTGSAVLVTGGFSGPLTLGALPQLIGNPGGEDVFIAAKTHASSAGNASSAWSWVTGGSTLAGNPPAPAGGPGDDRANAMAIGPGGQLYVGGQFEGIAQFGPVDTLSVQGDSGGKDGFVIKLGTDGRFFQPEAWTVGVPVEAPAGANITGVAAQPEFFLDNQPIAATGQDYRWFTWVRKPSEPEATNPSEVEYHLIPLQPTPEVEVRWRLDGEPTQSTARIPTLGAGVWPTQACGDNAIPGEPGVAGCYQTHIVGAPVEVKPEQYQILGDVIHPGSSSSGATLDAGTFNASRSGFAVIQYVLGSTVDQSVHPTYVEVVRSLPYQLTPGFQSDVEVEIGKKITSAAHNEPGRTGWVINSLAYYDGQGPNAAYNRAARSGSIIPVNRYSASRIQDAGRELAVAWYRSNGKGVYWPSRAVRYSPRWPYAPDRIVIASERGSEAFGQQLLSPATFPQAQIYVQNEFDKPGFNPNDEHALMAPSSTGSGYDAVFALRSDFGGDDDPTAPSDPYVLLKYFNTTSLEWNFKIYKVQATNPQYQSFRYSGTAGTTISPPYPVRLLPGCAESFVDGQARGEPAPPPFFQDHKNQLWAKSAGSGKVHYYYPMQPGFYQDNDNDDVNDYQIGQCTPWLARLPENQGGSLSRFDPIAVEYSIVWPEKPPLLVAGETLLKPKNDLPDIYNQAAVQIVYDDNRDNTPNAGPADTLAQLIDPLNPRWVLLAQLPEEVASETRDGLKRITGSSDGERKLPASLAERMYYDAMNKRLVFHGVFDESGAGDPKLLLNVMSKRERKLLKQLDGGDGNEAQGNKDCITRANCTWDEAIQALYRLTRNPNKIEKICRRASLDENRERVCDEMDTNLSADELLIAYNDPDKNGMLQPLSVLGSGAALTAGAATGSGYMTIAFNNDPSLGALPVSLEVIKVGCLESDGPSPVFAPYQGQINVIAPDNIFDEQLVLRHSGDFGGNPDQLEFQWFFHPDANGTPPMPLPNPDGGQMHGWIQFPVADSNGAVEISIEGANIQTLSDNWYLARYRGLSVCGNKTGWGLWAGQPGGGIRDTRAQLAEGWVKRVLARLNPFEARVQDFGQSETNNFASMLIQLGERYTGPVALNNDPDNLNQMGLIEAYTTVMRRALQLSVDSTPPIDYGPANAAVLLVASRLVDFYTLLGNEAYADAQDPTIGIDTEGVTINLNPSIFTFQNQLESPLDEELVLLRGRDTSHGPVQAPPIYNRLFWNFTRNDGEVAYALSYGITDQNRDGVIDEYDARIMFPQGHGDAWGHYLTAAKIYYTLLRHPFFSWNPQSEAVLVAGVPINVDYLDERQFAQTAVAKARAGSEIVDLTYRKAYTEDPNGQWQGYEDTKPERAWGLAQWGQRAGMGAYFDWVTVNAVLPEEDENPEHVGIQRIQRDTVSELDEIVGYYQSIQGQVDKADAGLNPLGLARGVVSFDIDPQELERYNKTQFEQVWERAMGALKNAFALWDHANQLNNQLRRVQNGVDAQARNSAQQETSFANRLIEIFGYPYVDDIGPGGTYPAGYNGADLYHYMYVDVPVLAGKEPGEGLDLDTEDLTVKKIKKFTGYLGPGKNGMGFFNTQPVSLLGQNSPADCAQFPMGQGCPLGDTPPEDFLQVEYVTIESPDYGLWFTKPSDWTGDRRAPGKLQQILHQMFMARIALKQTMLEYDKLRLEIEAQIDTVRTVFNTQVANMHIAHSKRSELQALTATSQLMKNGAIAARRAGEIVSASFETTAECIPKNTIVGLAGGGDLFGGARCAVQAGGHSGKFALDTVADGMDIAGNAIEAAKEDVSELSGIKTMMNDANLEMYNTAGEIDALLRQEPVLRAELYARTEAIKQLHGDYLATLAEGMRVYDQLVSFRRTGAADVQEYRYKDMAFRIFRNDALQKYRASFDLAARYVYLAATAYDYETNLLGNNSKAGQGFLTRIVKQRSLGQMLNGQPMAGSPGLADTMAQLAQNFAVLKGQMGFNAPNEELNHFSLRHELFRIPAGPQGDAQWQRTLEAARVADLWQVPEFRRMARPFAPQTSGPQPGLVLEFSTNVTFNLNFFGWDLGSGDSTYDSSRFATRIHSVGAAFGNYANLPLANDPRVYLMPAGADVLRAPDPNIFTVRDWMVMDQVIPIPFPVGAQDIQQYDWTPGQTLDNSPVAVRRYPQMRAYAYTGSFDESQVASDSRLVGRSVWNRRWLLIIPGATFLNDANEGLDTFIHGAKVPGGGGTRDGNGVDDIQIAFKTYSYTGS